MSTTGCPKVLVTKGQMHTDLFTLDHNLSNRTCFKESNAPRFVYTPSTGVSRCFIYSVKRTLICVISITRCPKVLGTKGQTHTDLLTLNHNLSKRTCFKESSAPRFVYTPSTGVSKSFIYSVTRTLICFNSCKRCPKVLVSKGQTHTDLFALDRNLS